MAKPKKNATRSPKTAAVDDDGWETLAGGGGTEPEIGEVIVGTFYGAPRAIPPKRKGQDPVPLYLIGDRTLLGGAVLRNRIEDGGVQPGDELEITRIEDLPAKKGQNPGKNWKVRIRRVTSKGFVPKPRDLGATAPKGRGKSKRA